MSKHVNFLNKNQVVECVVISMTAMKIMEEHVIPTLVECVIVIVLFDL
jgi:hypothetical protein